MQAWQKSQQVFKIYVFKQQAMITMFQVGKIKH